MLQLTNCILDSGTTYHMKPYIQDFIPGLLVETNKYIEVSDGHLVTAKQTGEAQIKMCDNNVKPFIAMLYNVLFVPYLCDQLFSMIKFMNQGHTCIYHEGFCIILFIDNEQNTVTLPHSTQLRYAFLVDKNKGKVKTTKSNS